ncbi:MAG: YqgE/AlgH family protein [Nakamurella sp.]
MPIPPAAGSLLVAKPSLLDPSFRRAVVLLLAHGEDGSLGVILNRPTESAVQEIFPQWQGAVAKPRVMYEGGPVERNSAMCVGVRRSGTAGIGGEVDALLDPVGPPFARVSGELVLVDLDAAPDKVMAELRSARVFAGHAGWGAGQLANEIDEGSWHVVDSQGEDVMAGPRVDLWFRVLRRQPRPLALEAYRPLDATLN